MFSFYRPLNLAEFGLVVTYQVTDNDGYWSKLRFTLLLRSLCL